MRDKSVKTRPTLPYRRSFCEQYVPGIAKMKGLEIGAAAHHDWMLDTVNVDISPHPENYQFKHGHMDIIRTGLDNVGNEFLLAYKTGKPKR